VRALFVCGKARARSPTAAQVFAEWPGVSADFGGLSTDADDALSADQIDWADLILVMEQRHLTRLTDRFGNRMSGKRVVTLNIRDRYVFMEPGLIEELIERAGPHLRRGGQ
jgi:predicted protein tyrosine phosphatase